MKTNKFEKGEGIVKRSTVTKRKNYLLYRSELRLDFWYSCAYCSITEVEAQGIGFEIDHYCPRSYCPERTNDYTNLMWSCSSCNKDKGDYFPKNDAQEKYYVISPDQDDPRNHFELKELQLEPKTETGEFNLSLLRLNRHQLKRVRDLRRRLSETEEYIGFGVMSLLSISLDQIKQEDRLLFKNLRCQLGEDYESLISSVKDFVITLSKSDLLDEDPNKRIDTKKRREYLRDIKAITPDYQVKELHQSKNRRKSKERKKQ